MLIIQGLIKYNMKQISFNNIHTRSPKLISGNSSFEVGMHNSWRGCRRFKRITPSNQMFWFSFTAS